MRAPLSRLMAALATAFVDEDNVALGETLHELTLVLPMTSLYATMQRLRDDPDFAFDALIDVAGVDYRDFAGYSVPSPAAFPARFAVVYHLLSTVHDWRLRVRAFVESDDAPAAPSMVPLWSSAGWMERECFDLFGIAFDGHPDLRRILTDYGFSGHPFRKDFPLSGHLEMRYDAKQKRVVYEPVSIEPRENVPRVVREPHYGSAAPEPLPADVLPPGTAKS